MQDKLLNNTDDGVLSLERIRQIPGYPEPGRFERGPVAVIECDQDIPCNPCEDICSKKAITVGNPITNMPVLNSGNCDGCIKCITICPGLCIFVIHKNYNDRESLIYLPYEIKPLPVKGSIVSGLDRKGQKVCEARIEKVIKGTNLGKTPVIGIAVPKDFFEIVRSIQY